jgi:peroxiredoxin Q/BCP
MDHRDQAPDFELANVGGWGPDPFRLSQVATEEDVEAIVLLLQRDHHCPKCRAQVREVAQRYDAFTQRGARVVSSVPEPVDRVRTWKERYDVPFALLSDPEKTVAQAYDQPTRFGLVGKVHDMIGRMPEAVILDTRDGQATPVFVHKGKHPADRPSVDGLLEELDRLLTVERTPEP